MSNEVAKASRILHFKIRTPSPDATKMLATMIKSAAPLYKAFVLWSGGQNGGVAPRD
jgi:hypothetical protein